LTEYDALQAHSLLNFVLQNPSVDIDNLPIIEDNISPVIYFNSTAGATGSYIVDYTGATAGVPYNTEDNGFTFSTSISLSTYGTSGVIDRDSLIGLLVDYIDDNRDGSMNLMPSNLIISGTAGTTNIIGFVGTYSLQFNFADLAQNDINNVIVNLDIIS
jgi:hypothetical protein